MKFKILVLLSAAVAFISSARNIDSITYKLQELVDKGYFNGSVVIMKDGKFLYNRNFGYSNPIENILHDDKSYYKIGSVSKTFTAALIFNLIEKKKLNLATTLDLFFPEVVNARRITIEMMLMHRSGIHSYTNEEKYYQYYTKPIANQEIIKEICSYPADFEPGEKFEYSNSNYFLLGLIAERITGKTYCQLINGLLPKNVRKNLICCIDTCNKNWVPSFIKNDSLWEKAPETYPMVALGAGSLAATASGVALFYDRLFYKKSILTNESLEKMTSFRDGVGMGVFKIPFYQKVGYGHTGGIDGLRSIAVYFPDDNVTMVVLGNSITDISLNDVAIGVLSAFYGIPHSFNIPGSYVPEEKILDACVGEYMSNDLPLDIKIFKKDGNKLFAQATGQQAIRLNAETDDRFTYKQAGIVIEFKEMTEGKYQGFILEQGGYRLQYQRK
ncbi:D-Ala-D-Ala carboxypeptidase [Thermaurantimonas aggregans]|uniref:D-Ala-D-Ala carboxypeptidase n=1 Tax=Thermaurantimonas aggregans TaxID=2173829 RepID=A0A401XNZ5_9FLAO|nr:serine hydrolase domain-containing protein [Thermaurantimonas aggregans]MCX8148619.1 beta-lactamase family protein [Thermaurantimonas aggregans]GCD78737.1 D-Ala-D-Ala carboxypeptidase [Thermaurantimonas aggregans]